MIYECILRNKHDSHNVHQCLVVSNPGQFVPMPTVTEGFADRLCLSGLHQHTVSHGSALLQTKCRTGQLLLQRFFLKVKDAENQHRHIDGRQSLYSLT